MEAASSPLTQRPIGPDEAFVYEFDVLDTGTYWYHPHTNSAEQMARAAHHRGTGVYPYRSGCGLVSLGLAPVARPSDQ
jgi:hypothetical protein